MGLVYGFTFIILICELIDFFLKCFICYQDTFPFFLISLFLMVCIFYSHNRTILLCFIPMFLYLCFFDLGEMYVYYEIIVCELTLLFYESV